MNVYAHRGASLECPENTMRAFRRALKLKVNGIELDVHLSSDGFPVVIHDATVDRTTDGAGAVAAMTLADLKELDAGEGERIPTLAEVIDFVGSAVHVDIEVKAGAAAEVVLQEAGRRLDLRWAMSSFDHDVLRFARNRSTDIELWPLMTKLSDEGLATALDLESPLIAIDDRTLTQELVESLIDINLGIWVWTVNEPQRARTLAAWGVAGVCTDDPRSIIDAVRSA